MKLEEVLPLLRVGAKALRKGQPFAKFLIRHGVLMREVNSMALRSDPVYNVVASLDGYSITANDWEVVE